MILWTQRNKKILLAIVTFCIVFIVEGLLFYQWGISVDDYGPIWNSKVNTLHDFFKLFYATDNFATLFPSNYLPQAQTFCNVIYRPLSLVFFSIQIPFFQANPLGYFLVMIFFHALNATLLFTIFSLFTTSCLMALWGALFFAFNYTMASWMGWIAAQSYSYGLTLLLLAIIFFFLNLQTHKRSFYLLAGISYLLAVFSFEPSIVFPVAMMLLGLAQDFIIEYFPYPKLPLQQYFQKTLIFWAGALTYLVSRLYLYPISISHDPSLNTFFSAQGWQIFILRGYSEAMTLLADLTSLSFIRNHHHVLKITLFLGIAFVCLWLFKKSKNKIIIIVLASIVTMFMWQAFVRCFYRPRYIYFSLPFFIMLILILFGFCKKHLIFPRVVTAINGVMLFCLLLLHSSTVFTAFTNRELETHSTYQAYEALAHDQRIHNRVLCFIGLPMNLGAGLAQGFWLRGINRHLPIYYDRTTFVSCESNIDPELSITPIASGFHLTVGNKNCSFTGDTYTNMGQIIIYSSDPKTGYIYNQSFIIDEKYLKQNMLFIGWDYTTNRFKILGFFPEITTK